VDNLDWLSPAAPRVRRVSRIEVDTDALATAVQRLHNAAAEAERLAACGVPSQLAAAVTDPVLGAAIARFTQAWGPALATLAGDTRRIADALGVAGRLYTDAEVAASITPLELRR
jgi:hypothetical protein